MSEKTILGVRFFSGSAAEAVDAGLRGGLVVVPSAPVLVSIERDPALRAGVLGADLAITDSGLMVLMWWLLKGEKLERVSGLEYLKLLLQILRPETGDLKPEEKPETGNLKPEGVRKLQVSGFRSQVSHAGGGVFWIMPTTAARDRNLAWLRSQGFATTEADCYVAPMYPMDGELHDKQLSAIIQLRRPAHIFIALGGGVQERLGFALKQSLEKPETGNLKPESFDPNSSSSSGLRSQVSGLSANPQVSGLSSQVSHDSSGLRSQVSGLSGPYRPGIHCIGAAIGFLSGEQVRIPMWVDYLYLGWLWRSVSAPRRFLPRYWKATRLVWLMLRYREKAPVAHQKPET